MVSVDTYWTIHSSGRILPVYKCTSEHCNLFIQRYMYKYNDNGTGDTVLQTCHMAANMDIYKQ